MNGPKQNLTASDAARLHRIAKELEEEAQTYAGGFAIHDGNGNYTWPEEDEFAHVRYVKLNKCAEYIRSLAGPLRPTPQEQENGLA